MADCGIIGGKYRLQRLLGSGGTAEVYLAWDIRLQKYWAVKKIRKAPGNQRMLERETELLGWLDHPALPRIVDRTEDCDAVYLVMDFIEGETLEHLLKREGPQEGVRIWEWARELAEVLDYLHTRQPPVLYRDLKPANILLQKEGRLKLVDLGIASADGRPAEGWGTRGYAAPEQLRGNPDCRSDIYCLGVTLYRCGREAAWPPSGKEDSGNVWETVKDLMEMHGTSKRKKVLFQQGIAELSGEVPGEQLQEKQGAVQKAEMGSFCSLNSVGMRHWGCKRKIRAEGEGGNLQAMD
ncbi:serine/threonine protein kinase [Lachnospiraceae bacterium OF09-33XD]|nr:serine/threonine protein kinase [Lachnospiraceae bacterium OF09-33XD]